MKYVRPVVVAQNNATGSYAMGCPTKDRSGRACRVCELRA